MNKHFTLWYSVSVHTKNLLPSQAECHQYHTISAYVTLGAALSQMHVRNLCMPPGLEIYLCKFE